VIDPSMTLAVMTFSALSKPFAAVPDMETSTPALRPPPRWKVLPAM
jgi:hypothetical protein